MKRFSIPLFSSMSRQRMTLALLMALAAFLVGSGRSLPAKPTAGGGGGTLAGTIYFQWNGQWATMHSDGSGNAPLPAGVSGDPSRLLHGGQRWFLQTRIIAGETYGDSLAARTEQFAVRGDGDSGFTVPLTNDPDLQFLSFPRLQWAPGENADTALIAGLARRWVWNGTAWEIDLDSIGVYTALIVFDADGNVDGLAAEPEFQVSLGVSGTSADVYGPYIDWSPDLTEIVYVTRDRSQLRAVNLLTDKYRTVTSGKSPVQAVWSPAGDRIAFNNGFGEIETIRPDGSGRQVIIKPDNTGYLWDSPTWSPTGSHLLCRHESQSNFDFPSDVVRVTADGKQKTILTGDLGGQSWPEAWR